MWQEILAVDSRLSEQRSMDRGYRPLYLKRRLQLLQGNFCQMQGTASRMECSNEKDEATLVTHRFAHEEGVNWALELCTQDFRISDFWGLFCCFGNLLA